MKKLALAGAMALAFIPALFSFVEAAPRWGGRGGAIFTPGQGGNRPWVSSPVPAAPQSRSFTLGERGSLGPAFNQPATPALRNTFKDSALGRR